MHEVLVADWAEFEQHVEKIRQRNAHALTPILFRGHRERYWKPETTLERQRAGEWSVSRYYLAIHQVRHQLESFTGGRWVAPAPPFLEERFTEYDAFSLRLSAGQLPAFEYLVYLRHMGFPSPLLDWTRSMYVAAFFAFRHASDTGPAIYVFSDSPSNMKMRSSDSPSIHLFGPNIPAHRRHFLQQSSYTISVSYESEWMFAPHEPVFTEDGGGEPDMDFAQDILWKFVFPASERRPMLHKLEEFNLNAYSLFGGDEALIESLALRNVFLADVPPMPEIDR